MKRSEMIEKLSLSLSWFGQGLYTSEEIQKCADMLLTIIEGAGMTPPPAYRFLEDVPAEVEDKAAFLYYYKRGCETFPPTWEVENEKETRAEATDKTHEDKGPRG